MRCPSCNDALLPGSTKCDCGWSKTKNKKAEYIVTPQSHRRCYMSGCRIDPVHSENGNDYCRYHYRHKDNYEMFIRTPTGKEVYKDTLAKMDSRSLAWRKSLKM